MKNQRGFIKRGLLYILIGTVLAIIGLFFIYDYFITLGVIFIALAGGFILPGFFVLFDNSESKSSNEKKHCPPKSEPQNTNSKEYTRPTNPAGDIYIKIEGKQYRVTSSSLCIIPYIHGEAKRNGIKDGDVFIFEGKRYAKKDDKLYLIEKFELCVEQYYSQKSDIIYKIQEIILEFEEDLSPGVKSCLPIILKKCKTLLHDDRVFAEEDIYALIMNTSFEFLASGEFHIDAGQINPLYEGIALYEVCKKCAVWLVNNDYMTGKEYIVFSDNLDSVILSVG